MSFILKNPSPGAGAGAQAAFIYDVTDDEFVEKVMEASTKTPILVDFWAAWCGPCKQLTPLLEQAVQKEKGRIHLAKIDVDANPGIAGQLQVRALPTVFAFWQGQPVHRFSGLLAPGQLQMLVDQLGKLADQTAAQDEARDGNIEKALENAENFLRRDKFHKANQLVDMVLGQQSDHERALCLKIELFIRVQSWNELANFQASLAESSLRKPAIRRALGRAKLLEPLLGQKKRESSGSLAKRHKKTPDTTPDKTPGDPETIRLLAEALLVENQTEAAVELLVDAMAHRGAHVTAHGATAGDASGERWGAVRQLLFDVLETMDPGDSFVKQARRRISQNLFA